MNWLKTRERSFNSCNLRAAADTVTFITNSWADWPVACCAVNHSDLQFQTQHWSPKARLSQSCLNCSCVSDTWRFLCVWVSAALLPSLPAVSVSLSVDVDGVLLPLSFPLGSVLALLLGPEHHVGEGHEHLNKATKRRHTAVRGVGKKLWSYY